MRIGLRGAAVGLVLAACAGTASDEVPSSRVAPTVTTSTVTTTTVATSTVGETLGERSACPVLPRGTPWQAGRPTQAVVLQEAVGKRPRVEAAVYPHPDYEGRPWSQWGQGLVLEDGRFLSAIGDHRGEDGNSFVFEYDPHQRVLTPISDVLSLVPHTDGDWGYGKIHAQMASGPCSTVWMATYWGTRRDLQYTDGYRGDRLFAIDPSGRTIHDLGVLYEEHGVPSLAGSQDGRLLYAEAADPARVGAGSFVAYDTTEGAIVFTDDSDAHVGFRSIAVDSFGRAYYSQGDASLTVFDPETNTTSTFAAQIPGEYLRAATAPDANGVVYGVSRDPEVFFALDPEGSVRTLGPARAYTTSIALSDDETEIYSVPDAHGGAWKAGAPLIATDTDTGDERVVVELADLAADGLGLRLGGTYSVAVDGKTIYIGMNAGPLDEPEEGFGQVVLLIVTLP